MIRFAKESDLASVNVIRRQVHALHASGEPDIFHPGFPDAIRDHIQTIFRDPNQRIVVAEQEGVLCGYAILHAITKPETAFSFARNYLDIDELGIDEAFRRRGIASEMLSFIKDFAKEQGFHRLELNMWEFNETALAFYEAAGFRTYRRYMEMKV
ncbi:MAG: GNAT family N-acetyltransferase [Clostridia bacterium]|nr:GNAT family N-acetyltransferase [Clostridia bacterium]